MKERNRFVVLEDDLEIEGADENEEEDEEDGDDDHPQDG